MSLHQWFIANSRPLEVSDKMGRVILKLVEPLVLEDQVSDTMDRLNQGQKNSIFT